MVVSLVTGTADFAVAGSEARLHGGTNGAIRTTTNGALATGDGALFDRGSSVSFRNTGDSPAVLLFVAVTPPD
jgi:hypothetical protein